MTIIAAAKCPKTGNIFYGSDRRINYDNLISELPTEHYPNGKFAVGRNCAVGVAGNFLFNNLIAERVRSGELDTDEPSIFYRKLDGIISGCGRFTPEKEEGNSNNYSFETIFISKEGIHLGSGDLSYVAVDDGFLGSGRECAIGAFDVLRFMPAIPMSMRLRISIEKACKFNSKCGGDIFVREFVLDN